MPRSKRHVRTGRQNVVTANQHRKAIRQQKNLRATIEAVREENEALKLEVRRSSELAADLRAHLDLLRADVAAKDANLASQDLELRGALQKIEFYHDQTHQSSHRIRRLESEIAESQKTVFGLRQEMGELKKNGAEIVRSAKSAQRLDDEVAFQQKTESLQNELKTLQMQSPLRGPQLKDYDKIKSQETKVVRFQRLIDVVTSFVHEKNVDLFLKDFIFWVSDNPKFAFRLRFTDWESYLCTIKLNLSDTFLKTFKRYMNDQLGFDCFSSRNSIDSLRRRCNPESEYFIRVETTVRTTKFGKQITASTPVCWMKDVGVSLGKRLTRLAKNQRLIFDEGTGNDVVIGVGGDKGGELTKMCLIIENIERPNNPRAISVLGYYAGSDTHAMLKEKFSQLFDQLNALKTVKYEDENGEEVERAVRIKAIGDCKFLSALLDHSGQSSNSPCFICEASWTKSGQNMATVRNFPFEVPGQLRTLQSLRISGNPLLHVDPSQIGPPGIHVILGVGQSYVVDWLFALCNKLDNKSNDLPLDLKQQGKALKSYQDEEEYYGERIQSLIRARDLQEAVEKVYKQYGLTGCPPSTSDSCSSDICVVTVLAKDKQFRDCMHDTFRCSKCRKDIHNICAGRFTEEESFRDILKPSVCLMCRRAAKKLTLKFCLELSDRTKSELQDQFVHDTDVFNAVAEEREELEGNLRHQTGETRRKLDAVFKSIGCDPRAWYQQMTGNQMRSLLQSQNISKVFSIFPDSPEVQSMKLLMEQLCLLMSQANNEVKNAVHMGHAKSAIERFSDTLRDVQPTASVTPKLHLLTAHLIPYMEQMRSWGRITEQGIEAMHTIFNSLARRFASVRDCHLNTCLTLQMLSNYTLLEDTGAFDLH